jgi:hypothetical protein
MRGRLPISEWENWVGSPSAGVIAEVALAVFAFIMALN